MEYKLYNSALIVNNKPTFQKTCDILHNKIKNDLNITDTTWSYIKYNIFSLSSTSILFYNLFQELNYYIRDYIGDKRPLWIQSWLNYHQYQEADIKLSYHGHQTEHHGYISIAPQDTKTVFKKGFEIINKPGQIYIGPGQNNNTNTDYDHYVKTLTQHIEPRITIGFNIGEVINNIVGGPSWIPLI